MQKTAYDGAGWEGMEKSWAVLDGLSMTPTDSTEATRDLHGRSYADIDI